ncbi:flagellin domain protein [Pseudovibrio sp. FO-BEG1]|uniref:flagellin N-terminal helical domain-containing protein n=1 Tax=Pseudovibrio sp. (strain FO-BEG1) TaxID=911045 RepID=UPI000238BF59|nr:flagellin [Pseudovibrio sp. FO-BEG1]AEV37120.1 flagellin domain protein [Pseudovibrio sp. FO-BEG1]
MSSLLTNSSAMVALQTLKGINGSMAETQNRISTGMRVSDASDNAAYWSIATTMKSDNKALSAVQDALGLGAATVDVAFTAMDKAVDVVDEIKAKLTTAKDGTVDKGKIQADIEQLQEQLQTIASSANFSGENWLQQDKAADNLNKEIVGSFTRTADGQVEIQNIDVDTSSIVLVDTNTDAAANSGILSQQFGAIDGNDVDPAHIIVGGNINISGTVAGGDFAVTFEDGAGNTYEGLEADALEALVVDYYNGLGTDPANAAAIATALDAGGPLNTQAAAIETKFNELAEDNILTFDVGGLTDSVEDKAILNAIYERVDATLQTMTDAATDLGSAKARVDMQKQFASDLSDAIDRGIGQLVDADMNEESTRLKALQTQQQLGIQALSIANNASQNILSLFR